MVFRTIRGHRFFRFDSRTTNSLKSRQSSCMIHAGGVLAECSVPVADLPALECALG